MTTGPLSPRVDHGPSVHLGADIPLQTITTTAPKVGSLVRYRLGGSPEHDYPIRITSVSPSGHKVTGTVTYAHRIEEKVFTRRGHGGYCERGTNFVFLHTN